MGDFLLYDSGELRVWVNRHVQETWSRYRQVKPSQLESFGVLIGSTSVDLDEIFIEEITTPKLKDRQSRTSFELMDAGHQESVDNAYECSGGKQIYLGTWHTHPQSVPTPSGIDIDDWIKCLGRNRSRVLVFFIVGTKRTKLFVRKRNVFIPIDQKS